MYLQRKVVKNCYMVSQFTFGICGSLLPLGWNDVWYSANFFDDSTAAYLHTRQGTVAYMAPEMCEEDDYTAKADIWSLGVTFYQLATFKLPVSLEQCTMSG